MAELFRFEIKLNPDKPRDSVIIRRLKELKRTKEASGIVRQIMWERLTGRDWVTGEPLQISVMSAEEATPDHPVILNEEDLSALDEDYPEGWGQ